MLSKKVIHWVKSDQWQRAGVKYNINNGNILKTENYCAKCEAGHGQTGPSAQPPCLTQDCIIYSVQS